MVSNEGLKGLEWKVVLSTISDWEDWIGNVGSQELAVDAFNLTEVPDPRAEPFGDYVLETESNVEYTISNTDDFGKLQQPNHYQDSLHKNIIDLNLKTKNTLFLMQKIENIFFFHEKMLETPHFRNVWQK